MPPLRTYHLFISHAWRYDEDYKRRVYFLDQARNFQWKNYSVPRHDPVLDPKTRAGQARLRKELTEQIRPVQCVLVLAGMYVAYSDWIQFEIDVAQAFGKPIVGVVPWGQERTPNAVAAVAKEMVSWRTDAIVDAIRQYAKNRTHDRSVALRRKPLRQKVVLSMLLYAAARPRRPGNRGPGRYVVGHLACRWRAALGACGLAAKANANRSAEKDFAC
jgi:hypothetical protein